MQLLICSVRARDELFILRLIKKLSIEATRSIFHARFHCFSSRLAPRSSLTRFNISAREQFRCVCMWAHFIFTPFIAWLWQSIKMPSLRIGFEKSDAPANDGPE